MMDDEVSKRREARRRKILENSHTRLSKITGVEERSSLSSSCLTSCVGELDDTRELRPRRTQIESDVNELRASDTAVNKKPPRNYKVTVIFGLVVFMNMLRFVFESYGNYRLSSIFLPMVAYEGIELLSQNQQTSNPLVVMFLTSRAQNNNIVALVKYLTIVMNVFHDVMIYFFAYVWCEFFKYLVRIAIFG